MNINSFVEPNLNYSDVQANSKHYFPKQQSVVLQSDNEPSSHHENLAMVWQLLNRHDMTASLLNIKQNEIIAQNQVALKQNPSTMERIQQIGGIEDTFSSIPRLSWLNP